MVGKILGFFIGGLFRGKNDKIYFATAANAGYRFNIIYHFAPKKIPHFLRNSLKQQKNGFLGGIFLNLVDLKIETISNISDPT